MRRTKQFTASEQVELCQGLGWPNGATMEIILCGEVWTSVKLTNEGLVCIQHSSDDKRAVLWSVQLGMLEAHARTKGIRLLFHFEDAVDLFRRINMRRDLDASSIAYCLQELRKEFDEFNLAHSASDEKIASQENVEGWFWSPARPS